MYVSVCFFFLALLGLKGGTSHIPAPTSYHLNQALVATNNGSFGSLSPLFHQASVVKIGLVHG